MVPFGLTKWPLDRAVDGTPSQIPTLLTEVALVPHSIVLSSCPCTTQHSFKQPGKILLVCYSTHHSFQFDMPHDLVVRNLIFDPAPPTKSHPKGCSWGHKVNPVQYVLHLSLLSICAHFRIKIFKIDFEIGNC